VIYALAFAELVVISLLVILMWRMREREARFLAEISREWAEERGRLVAAVKHPNFLPTVKPDGPPPETHKPRDLYALSAIGTVGAGRPPEIEDDA
jgi:hypothetical protein